ncbi:ATP-binding protein [Aliidiomarina soli]|uniref:histidine kinase n=1 Tax=Aliidiomarina soli TaxID=1928574 RepID=A0A432WJ86_9GAMM|nr:ATP-binding protein [Aliidiomarina soli]RUO33870.1 hypothetical protein CWE14_05275 [Aliidiomarina soli]
MKKLGLSTGWQLFVAIAGVALILVMATLVGIRLYFIHNFNNYLSAQETQRMQELAVLIADYYERQTERDADFRFEQLGELERGGVRRLLAGLSIAQWRESRQQPQSDGLDPRRLSFRNLALYSADGDLLFGRDINDPIQVSIVEPDSGVTLGYLRTGRPQGPLQPIDEVFQQQQMAAILLAGFAALLVAALVAAILARRLRRRVSTLTRATRRLAAGAYDVEVPQQGRDELTALAADINALARTLRAAAGQRQAFMADIAHELRTPLTILQAELEALEDGIRHLDAQEMGLLQGQVRQLTQLVDDLHMLADADAGSLRYQWQPLTLNGWLQEQWPVLSHQAEQAGLKARLKLPLQPLSIKADPQRLQQLLMNVWSNSMRYTDAPGEVELELAQVDNAVQLIVRDSAPGVAESAMKDIFRRLYREEGSRNRRSGGSGLGLAICERIAQAHAGTLTATQSALGGLQICLSMPDPGVTSQ